MRILLFTVALALSLSSFAENSCHEDMSEPDRMLEGHLFQYPSLHRSAFIQTSFGMNITGALVRGDFTTQSQTSLGDLKLIGGADGLNFSIKLVHWLALEAAAQGSAMMGQTTRMLLLHGAQIDGWGELGLI